MESLRFLQKERQLAVYAYVFMEHRRHLVASGPELSKSVREFEKEEIRWKT